MNDAKQNWVERAWYGDSFLYWLLLPLSGLFAALAGVRRFLYRSGLLKVTRVDAPVVVVGNIAAGGTGKTPVTIWLVRELQRRGQVPGIISRGYRGNVGPVPMVATEDSDVATVGDEAIMLARQCECPVIVHPDRVAAAKKAIAQGANILVSDDGLQHYRLYRDAEIAVVDGNRGFGNGTLLPAGPLREPVTRLEDVDVVLIHRHSGDDGENPILRRATDPQPVDFRLRVAAVVRVDNSEVRSLDDFAGETVHAVAGIGHPERFFRMLEAHRIKVDRHPMPDHADIEPADISFDDDLNVLMTEKDAVKCRWLDTASCWYVAVDVEFEAGDGDEVADIVFAKFEEGKSENV